MYSFQYPPHTLKALYIKPTMKPDINSWKFVNWQSSRCSICSVLPINKREIKTLHIGQRLERVTTRRAIGEEFTMRNVTGPASDRTMTSSRTIHCSKEARSLTSESRQPVEQRAASLLLAVSLVVLCPHPLALPLPSSPDG